MSDADATELVLLRELELLVRQRLGRAQRDAAGKMPRPRFEREGDVFAQLDAVREK